MSDWYTLELQEKQTDQTSIEVKRCSLNKILWEEHMRIARKA
jgi:hypothetical protein